MELGNYTGASAIFDTALKEDPQNPLALKGKELAQNAIGNNIQEADITGFVKLLHNLLYR